MTTTLEGAIYTLDEAAHSERFEPETPFLDTRFVSEAWAERESPGSVAAEQQWTPQVETPFIAEYFGEAPVNLEAQALEQTLMELFDQEFNEAVSNLALEAAAQAEHFSRNGGEPETVQMLEEWLDPLRRATERLFEQAGEAVTQQQLDTLSESEFETVFEAFAPQPGMVAPEFEDFFKKIWTKLKSVARTAGNLAKKGLSALAKLSPLHFLIKRLGRLVRPLLRMVIRFAIGKLPIHLQPLAQKLGRRMGILREAEAGETQAEYEVPTTSEAETIAQEFDVAVATLLFARDESEVESFLNEATQETVTAAETNPIAELDAARERFVTQFSQLQNGESPGPIVQQFIPALLPILRIGIRFIGRNAIVKLGGQILAPILKPFVGPAMATTLSRAFFDAGLRLVMLETEMEPAPRLAARAVAATLEDTMRRIANFGFEHFDNLDENLDQLRLFETVVNEAFFEASIAHFPAQLLDVRRLEEREMYLENPGEQAYWAYRPRPRYKKYTKVFPVLLKPQNAERIVSFGNESLSAFLRARGVRLPAKVNVHLYETIPGTTVSHIALLEKSVPGLGTGSQQQWSKIHALTVTAALALGLPASLGRDVDAQWLQSRHRLTVGQRLYYIEIAEAGRRVCSSQVNVTVDLRASQVRVSVYFSEADAQRIVAAGPAGGTMTALRFIGGLSSAAIGSIRGGPSRHVRFLREASGAVQGEEFLGKAAAAAGEKILAWLFEELAKALLRMLKAALIQYLNARFVQFAETVRKPADGVTLVMTFNHPGLRVLHVALAGRVPSMSDVSAAARAIQFPSVEVVPGYVWR
jgi:hypothetical protein